MLTIQDKSACCGCQACYDACPAKCISMVADNEGFMYPKANPESCLNCHLCEKVCPQINSASRKPSDNPVACYAAYSNDEAVRRQSTSGGVFSLLAESVLKRGGVVFGARFDDSFAVFHSFTETEEGLSPFRGSKYAQSDLRGAYSKVRQFLKENRPVLFSGTPCQIAGLRAFLHQEDNANLYLVSVVCHGAPSPLVWKEYLDSITGAVPPTSVNMRNKDDGWRQYKMVIQREGHTILKQRGTDTSFMRAFLRDLTLRPSCYTCPFRGNHGSDLTLGDFWGVEQCNPDMFDDNGTSLILEYTEKGRQLLSSVNLVLKESRYEDAVKGNPSIVNASPRPAERDMFWTAFRKHGIAALDDYTSSSRTARLRRGFARLLRKVRRK